MRRASAREQKAALSYCSLGLAIGGFSLRARSSLLSLCCFVPFVLNRYLKRRVFVFGAKRSKFFGKREGVQGERG